MNSRAEADATTCDRFQDGAFELIQPKGWGYRSGLDALLLAASVPAGASGRAADLGAGAGAVGFSLAARCRDLHVTLVEREASMAALSARARDLPANSAFADRLSFVEADILLRRSEREAAGLPYAGFRLVVTNPPFHPPGGRVSPDATRGRALAMSGEDVLARWIAAAAALLEPRGVLAMIARPDNLGAILPSLCGRLGDARIMPVHTAFGRPATRILLHARKGSRAPLSLLPPAILRGADGRALPLETGIANGTAVLDLGLL